MVVEKTEKIHPCYVFCCVSDPIKIMARTNAAGYTPGQVCQIEININNQSDVSIVRIIVELVKVNEIIAINLIEYKFNVNF